jgi:hypothetical protein
VIGNALRLRTLNLEGVTRTLARGAGSVHSCSAICRNFATNLVAPRRAESRRRDRVVKDNDKLYV